MKKVYFARAISGDGHSQNNYMKEIKCLEKKFLVLNNPFTKKVETAEKKINSCDINIYKEDIELIEVSDIVIAECSIPSLGVGYELAYAERFGKLVYVLYNVSSKNRLSAMINGNEHFIKYFYKSDQQLMDFLENIELLS